MTQHLWFAFAAALSLSVLAPSAGAFSASAVSVSGEQIDQRRVQAHLLAAEAVLRERDVSELPLALAEARLRSLDVLHRYAERGIFPRNIAFQGQRAPYFIDDGGRACAVAEILIEAGGRDVANEVAARENNAYVADMKAPTLRAWVAASGFTLDELAYIQPDYCGPRDENDLDCVDLSCYSDPHTPCTCEETPKQNGVFCKTEGNHDGGCLDGQCAEGTECGFSGRSPSGSMVDTVGFGLVALLCSMRRRRRGFCQP